MEAGRRQFGRDMKTAPAQQSIDSAAPAAGAAVYYYYGIASAGPA
jgi:hypothetical protein